MRKVFFVFIIIFYSSLFSALALAEETFLHQDALSISPVLIELELKSGEIKNARIEVSNSSDHDQKLVYSVQDFEAGNVGGVKFLPLGENQAEGYGLKDWVVVEHQPEFVVPAGGHTFVDLSVTAPLSASVGSHYGGVLFSFLGLAQGGTVKVERKLATLIIARNGRGVVRGEMNVSYSKIFSAPPLNFNVSFKNTGSAHLAPKGEVHLYNIFGSLVESIPVNRDADIVLPNTTRDFHVQSQKTLFGRYRVQTILFYGADPKLETHFETTIWVFPARETWSWLSVIVAGLVLLYFAVSRYNKFLRRKHGL